MTTPESEKPPEDLLAEATAQYERYLEIADVSRIPTDQTVDVPRPAPLGLVIWSS